MGLAGNRILGRKIILYKINVTLQPTEGFPSGRGGKVPVIT
jgi:hypothetical protein